MSTRATIWCNPRGDEGEYPSMHLYEQLFGDHVALEIESGPFQVILKLPPELIAAILKSETCSIYAEHGTTDPQQSNHT